MNSTLPPAGSEPPLLLQEVHAATPAGQAQLRGGLTTLSSVALELLIRVDGELTLEQISAGMPQVSPDAFMAALRELRDRGLVEPARSDPFTFDFQSFVDSEAMSQGGAEADSGLRSLTRAGYYVGIARPRPTARVRAPGTALWAVVVEDEPILARFIQSYLSFDGFKVRTAANRA